MRLFATLLLGSAMLAILGCGEATTDVTGKVTFNDKPVVFGSVMIVGPDGLPKYGAIQPDGTYRVSGVRLGAARVAVSSPKPPGLKLPGDNKKKVGREEGLDDRRPADANATVDPAIAKGWFTLPDKYGDPSTSNLTTEVIADLVLDLPLK